MARSSFLDLSRAMQDSVAAALVTRHGRRRGRAATGWSESPLVEIGGETDAAVFGRRRLRQLADRGEDCGDRPIVGGELFLETRLELLEFLSELSVRD